MPRRFPRLAAPLLVALATITCTDSLTGPRGGRVATVALRPEFSTAAAQAAARMNSFAMAVNNIHVVLVRPPSTVVVDTVVPVAPADTAVSLTMKLELVAASETFEATIELRQDATVLFQGTQSVTATTTGGANGTPISLSYAGPGSTATAVKISPASASVPAGSAIRLTAQVIDASASPVSGLPLAWTSVNPAIATVDSSGLVRGVAPGAARIAVTALSGLTDTVPVTVTVAAGPAARLQVVRQPASKSRVGFVLDTVPSVQVVDSVGTPVARAGLRILAHPIPQFAYDTTPCLRASASRQAPSAPMTAAGFTREQVAPRFIAPSLHAPTPLNRAMRSRFPVRRAPDPLLVRSTRIAAPRAANRATPALRPVAGPAVRAIAPTGGSAKRDFFYAGCGPLALTTSDTAVTDSTGRATFTGLRLYGEKGTYAIEMIPLDTGLVSATTGSIVLAPGNPDHVNAYWTWFSTNPGDTVRDAQMFVQDTVGNGIAGETVHWFTTQGTLAAATSVTDTGGAATQPGWVVPDTAGSFTMLGIADAFPADTIVFTAQVMPLQPSQVIVTGGQDQLSAPGAALGHPLSLQVLDQNGKPMTGVQVQWVPYTGGTVTDTLTTTDSSGSTSIGYTMSATPGYRTEWVEYLVRYNGSYWCSGYFFAYSPPPAMTRMWLPHDTVDASGYVTSSDAWADTANWQPHGVPTQSDFTWVPSTWRSNPRIATNTPVGTLWVEGGAYVEVDSFDLDVYGDLRAQYTGVDGGPAGRVVLHKTNAPVSGYMGANVVVLDGAVPDTIYGSYFDAARDVVVSGGVLDIQDVSVYVGGNFSTQNTGSLRMATNAGASLQVSGDATFAGASTKGAISTGWIYLGGKLQQLATVSTSSLSTSGTNWIYMYGDSLGTSSVNLATPGASHLWNLQLDATTTTLSPGIVVDSVFAFGSTGNAVTLSAPGAITVNGALQLSTASDMRGIDTVVYHGPQFPTTYDSLSYGPKLLRVTASTTSNWYSAGTPWNGSVEVDSGAAFAVNDSLWIRGAFTVKGAGSLLAMQSTSSHLIVDGDATFDGGDESSVLTQGMLEVRGNFTQAATNSPLAFAASSGLLTVFSGTSAQAVTFATPDSLAGSRFGAVQFASRDSLGVKLASNAVALDSVRVADSTRLVIATGDTLTAHSWFALGNASRLTLDGWLTAASCSRQASAVVDGANAGQFVCPAPSPIAALSPAAAAPLRSRSGRPALPPPPTTSARPRRE